jgi:hypothetical protein
LKFLQQILVVYLYFFDFWPLVQRFKSRARYSHPRKTTNQYENPEKVRQRRYLTPGQSYYKVSASVSAIY